MLHRTTGFVLRRQKYSETSVIVRILTEKFGLQSYLISGVRKTKSRQRPALFQPMTKLDLVAYHKEKGGLLRIKEMSVLPYRTIPFDTKKTGLSLFIAEVLYRSVRNEERDPLLFEFIAQAVDFLDRHNGNLGCFPAYFLIRLSKFLGCLVGIANQEQVLVGISNPGQQYFDMIEGKFTSGVPIHSYYLLPPLAAILRRFSGMNFDAMAPCTTDYPGSGQCMELTRKLVQFYKIHLGGFNGLYSVEFLESLND